MRRRSALVTAVVGLFAILTPLAVPSAGSSSSLRTAHPPPALGPAPWLINTGRPDPSAAAKWKRYTRSVGPAVLLTAQIPDPSFSVSDTESPTEAGLNDSADTGIVVEGFGTGEGEFTTARVFGELAPPPPAPIAATSSEDDGEIGLANPVALSLQQPVAVTGVIGDGPHGTTGGDFDHFALSFLNEGEVLIVDVANDGLSDPVDTVVSLYDIEGNRVATNDDEADAISDSYLTYVVEASGEYVVAVAGCCLPQANALESGSGVGPGSTGSYLAVLTLLPEGSTGSEGSTGRSLEDDGAISLANFAALEPGVPAAFTGVIGDGPHGESTGDFDFFALGLIAEGQRVVIDTDTDPQDGVDTIVGLFDDTGALIAANDDFESLDSFLDVEVPAPAEYFAAVAGCCELPPDPFDSASGFGPGSTGPYKLTLGIDIATTAGGAVSGDTDVYLVDLDVGDVLSIGVAGAPFRVEIRDPVGVERMGSVGNLSFIYPASSPLRHQGDIGADHVAAVAGTHAVVITAGSGSYAGELRVKRAEAEAPGQVIYLDFDGAAVDATIFGPGANTRGRLSPLRDFLFRWGLDQDAEDEMIDAVIARVTEDLGELAGSNVTIVTSRDGVDPWGMANVSRVVIGGSSFESGIPTIGIAQSIDPGNFDREETTLVLLDSLSGPSGTGFGTVNDIPLGSGVSRATYIGGAIGTVTSHEIGHLVGNWHTATFNKIPSIMDAGGNLPGALGVGPDGVGGNSDDVDVDFVTDEFESSEGITGFEDTVTRTATGIG